jgi:hypothetical protein
LLLIQGKQLQAWLRKWLLLLGLQAAAAGVERFIYFQDRSAYSAAGKYVDQSWEYINRSQTHVEIGTEAALFPEKEYIKGIFLAVWIFFLKV